MKIRLESTKYPGGYDHKITTAHRNRNLSENNIFLPEYHSMVDSYKEMNEGQLAKREDLTKVVSEFIIGE